MLSPGMQGRNVDSSALSLGWQTIEKVDPKKLQFTQESHAGRKKKLRAAREGT